MMYPRLKLARNLLTDDGVIFISIDDNEQENLKKICNEIFGENNFINIFVWQARTSKQNDTDISGNHEYILAYAKTRRLENRRLKSTNIDTWYKEKSFAYFPLPLDINKFDNIDNDLRGLWKADPFDAPNIRPNLTYEIVNPNTGESYWPPKGRCWRVEEKKYLDLLKDNRIIFGKDGKSRPQLKSFYEEKKIFGEVETTWWTGNEKGTSTLGTKELMNIFNGEKFFDFPKPTKLLRDLMKLSVKQNSIVLDFFSGSATTAHAVMQLNAEDGGNRKYIMVQLPEVCDEKSEAYKAGYKNICEIGKERIRRAGEKIKSDETLPAENREKLDIGFKVFKLDSSNIKEWDSETEDLRQSLFDSIDNIKSDRTSLDILYEILLKYGLDLNVPIVENKHFYSIGGGTLLINLDKEIDMEVIDSICEEYKTLLEIDEDFKTTVVLRDSSFANDVDKTNAMKKLEQVGIKEVRSI